MSDTRGSGRDIRTGLLYEYDVTGGFSQPDRLRDLIGARQYTRAFTVPLFVAGVPLSCDSPYGYVHGETSEERGRSFTVISPLELVDLCGTEINVNDDGHWRVANWHTRSGAVLPPLVFVPVPAPPPLPPNIAAGAGGVAVAHAPTLQPAYASTVPPTPVVPPKIVVPRKTVLEQALDEGYNPLCKDSPTGLQRPKHDSPTQMYAYLISCGAVDIDLAVNELEALMTNPYGFFGVKWPDYKKELAGELAKALVKVG